MLESNLSFSFEHQSSTLDCIEKSRDLKEQLLQYNLDETLQCYKFHFTGSFSGHMNSEYETMLQAFFSDQQVLHSIQATGDIVLPSKITKESIGLNVMTMDFFDRLEEGGIIGPGGQIKGCFDDVFDGIMVGDLLREMLVNENSEHACLYSDSEKYELIYQIFRVLVIGGNLCQPEISIEKYLNITKAVYKELVTVFKDSNTKEVKVSGKAYLVQGIEGIELFPANPTSSWNVCILLIDPLKKTVTMLKNTYKKYW